MQGKKLIKFLLEHLGTTYAEELGINLKSKKSTEIFKWFLAAILFGARISEIIAKNTYLAFKKYNLLTPKAIANTDWKFLVKHVMAEGGYVRYDEKTTSTLLEICNQLLIKYNGNLNTLHNSAKNYDDLVKLLLQFKGIGPVTVNIFLRELRMIWPNATPPFCEFVLLAAHELEINDIKQFWQKNAIPGYDLVNFEAALLRLGKDYCHKNKPYQHLITK